MVAIHPASFMIEIAGRSVTASKESNLAMTFACPDAQGGHAMRRSTPIIASASGGAVATTGRSVWTTHERRASGPLTGPVQLESSESREDYEDGGPTIRLPAAESAAPFIFVSSSQYNASMPAERRRWPDSRGPYSLVAACNVSDNRP